MHSLKILFTPHLQKMYSIKETLALWKESYNKPGQPMKKQRHHFADKGSYSQRYGFSSSHVQMWELDHKEAWVLKNWCFWTVMLETLDNPSDCKEIKPVNPKGNQLWIFTGRTDAEAPMLWPPDSKSWLIGKDVMFGKIQGKRRRGKQRMRWLDGITDSMDMSLSELWETVKRWESWHAAVHGVRKSWTWQRLNNIVNLPCWMLDTFVLL